jgi:hypothetical protein
MGNGASIASSNMEAFVGREFDRVRGDAERTYLTLPEMIRLRSIEQLPVDFADLGTLFCLDADRDGMVTLPELTAFMLLCSAKSREYKAHEFQARMAAFAAAQLWEASIKRAPAAESEADTPLQPQQPFVEWMTALVRHSSDSDLDLSASLDASIDFAALAEAKKGAPAATAAAEGVTAAPSDDDDAAADADEASEVVSESPFKVASLNLGGPPKVPSLNLGGAPKVPSLNLGGGGGGNKGVVTEEQPAVSQWLEDSAPSNWSLPTIPSPTAGSMQQLVGMDTVKLIFDLLHVADVAEIDFQSFVDLLQQVAEEGGMLNLENEKYDHVVPVQVIVQFATDFMGALDTWMVGLHGGGGGGAGHGPAAAEALQE